MCYATEPVGTTDDTRESRRRLGGKIAGVLVPLAVVMGGGVSAFGLTIEGAGVLGNGLMLSLFSSSKTPPVTMVERGSPAPTPALEIPANPRYWAIPPRHHWAEYLASPVKAASTPFDAEPLPEPSFAHTPAAVNVTQVPGTGAASFLDPAGASSPTLAAAVEAPEPTTGLLVGTGLLVLAGTRRCRRRPAKP